MKKKLTEEEITRNIMGNKDEIDDEDKYDGRNQAEIAARILNCDVINNHEDQEGMLKYLSDFLHIDQKFKRDCQACTSDEEFISKMTQYKEMVKPITFPDFVEKIDNIILYSFSRYSVLSRDMSRLHFEIELYLTCAHYRPEIYNADTFLSKRS